MYFDCPLDQLNQISINLQRFFNQVMNSNVFLTMEQLSKLIACAITSPTTLVG
jgi:hypothetical protein